MSVCRQKRQSEARVCVMRVTETEERPIHVSKPALSFFLSFVLWPSKTFIALPASHRIGLLCKSTTAEEEEVAGEERREEID